MNRKLGAAVGVAAGSVVLALAVQTSAQATPDVRPVSGTTSPQKAGGNDAEPQALLSVAVRAAKAGRSVTRQLAGGDDVAPADVPADVPVDHAFDQ